MSKRVGLELRIEGPGNGWGSNVAIMAPGEAKDGACVVNSWSSTAWAADAAELVRRWNAHDELVTVAAEAAQILERHHAETGEHVRGANIAALHAAVRNARGGK